jgi:hypothetical protein
MAMEDNAKVLESLLEKAVEFGKTTYELEKLKALNKSSDIASTLIPHSAVFISISSFMLFVNLGLALWLGEILGRIFFGFFLIAGFYAVLTLIIHFFMHKWLKKLIWNYIIRQLLK